MIKLLWRKITIVYRANDIRKEKKCYTLRCLFLIFYLEINLIRVFFH